MDVRDHGDAHRRRTVTRAAAAVIVTGAWGLAAWLLLGSRVPGLDLPALDPQALFPEALLDRARAYRSGTRWLWVAATLLELAALVLLTWKARPLTARVRGVLRIPEHGRVRTGTAVALTAAVTVWLATLPVDAVRHWWRRRYGLSEQGYAGWLADQSLGLLVLALVVCLVVAVAVALAVRFGRRWWIPGSAAVAVIGALVVLAQPVLIEPLTTRTTPLRDPALVAGIEEVGTRLGVRVEAVDVADASRRTSAANAHVFGVGPTREVVLTDTLLDGRFTEGEVLWISAHELAHVARDHVWRGVAWFALLAVPGLAAIAGLTERRGGLRDPALVPLALLTAFVLALVAQPVANAVSRRYEAEADWLALVATGDPAADVALQRRLVRTNLADPDPPAWSRVLLGTHPTVLERIGMARAFASRP